MTTPVFILNTGRSGSFAVTRALNMLDGVEAVHQYNTPGMTALGALRRGGNYPPAHIRETLRLVYLGPVYGRLSIWADCSNKLPWLGDILLDIYPDAKIIHLIRDGRRVCSSYFHKFDYYSDDNVKRTKFNLDNFEQHNKYEQEAHWFPIPVEIYPRFLQFSRWQRLCWHWVENNTFSLLSMYQALPENQFTVKLEDLVSKREWFHRLCQFIGAEFNSEAWQSLEKPHNVVEPVSYPITNEQLEQYKAIAGPMHERLGYTWEEVYQVEY